MKLRYKSMLDGRMATRTLATIMLAGTLFGGEAQAQVKTSQEHATEFEGILVTARRREEDIQSVPIAITAVDKATLENFQVQKLDNLQALEPTFSVSASSGRPNAPVYSLRGIRPTESIYGQDPTVAIYLADVVQSPAQGSNLGFYDLENVQILKGPQGTLFGRNTVGGAILLTPAKPGDEVGGTVMAGIGNYGLFEAEAAIDLPITPEFRIRVSGRMIDGGDYQTNVAPGPLNGTKLGGQDTKSFRITAVNEFSPNVTNTLMLTYDDYYGNGRGTVLQAVNPLHPRATSNAAQFAQLTAALTRAQGRDINDIESDLVQFDAVKARSLTDTFEAGLSDNLTFKFIGNYREVESVSNFDLDASTANILTSDQTATLKHWSLEGQLQGTSFNGNLDWVIGLYHYVEKGTETSPGNFYGLRIMQEGIVNNTSSSVFAQGSYKLTPDLTFTAGVRLNRDKKQLTLTGNLPTLGLCSLRVDANMDGIYERLPFNNCRLTLNKSFSQPTGTVSLDYKLSPDVLVYASARLGYRSGGFNLRADEPVEYEPFKPETVTDLEIGAKADWYAGGAAMRTNVAFYFQKYDDIQRTVAVLTAGGSPGSQVVNAAKAEVFGIEVQQTIRPTDNLTLKLNYSYVDPKYKSWNDLVGGVVTDISDTPFFFTPKHSGSAMLTYEYPLGDAGTLRFGANAAYTDDIWINALHTSVIIDQHPASVLPLLKQNGYWLVDLNAGWDNVASSGIDLSFWVKNLTDKEYKVGGVQLYTGATGFIGAAYGTPRTYGAQARIRF